MAPRVFDLPEIEYLDGQAFPKVTPGLTPSLVQARLCAILREAAGDVDGRQTKLVPGAAFAPDVAVEGWSPSNDRAYLGRKIARYRLRRP